MNALQTSQITALAALLVRRPQVQLAGPVEQFVLQYVFFEAALRIVLAGYRNRASVKTTKVHSDRVIQKNVVVSSFAHFGILVTQADVDHLLDSKRRNRGSKSARELRNGLIHEWNADDAKEVEARASYLLALLASGLQSIEARALPPP